MAITNYTELQAAVASWMHRSDLTSIIPDCIVMAEEKFNRRLRLREQENDLSATAIVDYEVTLPSNIVAVKSMWISGQPYDQLKPRSLESVMQKNNGGGGQATVYAWKEATWYFNGTGTIEAVYYEKVPDLATNTTNWLLDLSPTVYLFGALAEAMIWAKETQEAGLWAQRCDAVIEELKRRQQVDVYSGPIEVRAR